MVFNASVNLIDHKLMKWKSQLCLSYYMGDVVNRRFRISIKSKSLPFLERKAFQASSINCSIIIVPVRKHGTLLPGSVLNMMNVRQRERSH